jgi:hypothetical protein
MTDGMFCVRKAFSDIQRAAVYKQRKCASSCDCQFCRSQRMRSRQQTEQRLRERLEAINQEAKQNRQIREQRESEYQKTVRLLNLIKGPNNQEQKILNKIQASTNY